MNTTNPAIVAQSAVRRLPRFALLLLCLVYVLAGFIGRAPWRNADITAFGYMMELASYGAWSHFAWLEPKLMGLVPDTPALLPYWLGAWAVHITAGWIAPDIAVRLPYLALLSLTLCATWYGVYYLARSPQAQPVVFAFGGEARPIDYARAMADAGLMALIACLGMAQLSHETTPAAAQLCFAALSFYGFSVLPYRKVAAGAALFIGLAGLALSGATGISALLGLGGGVVSALSAGAFIGARKHYALIGIASISLLIFSLAWSLNLWSWPLLSPGAWNDWRRLSRLLLWFTWPAWPLVLWTLWRWRHQWRTAELPLHLALPSWFAACGIGTALWSASPDRALLLSLPALACLAAFALPTLRRSVSALIDWFTLLFFSGCAVVIWVVWIAMQTGIPRQPAANVAKLAPGFEPSFSVWPFLVALAATLAWCWLVRWRVGKNPAAIWKSLVLPASGAVLSWLLLMSLWLPLLDHARSYTLLVRQIAQQISPTACMQVAGISGAQIAALRYHGGLHLIQADVNSTCPWLLVQASTFTSKGPGISWSQWKPHWQTRTRKSITENDDVILFKRLPEPTP